MTSTSGSHPNQSPITCPGYSTDLPLGNGKAQPWRQAWPPKTENVADVVEAQGQMLLLDGTGGSGTAAVPNAVLLPPKPQEPVSKSDQSEKPEEKQQAESEARDGKATKERREAETSSKRL